MHAFMNFSLLCAGVITLTNWVAPVITKGDLSTSTQYLRTFLSQVFDHQTMVLKQGHRLLKIHYIIRRGVFPLEASCRWAPIPGYFRQNGLYDVVLSPLHGA